MQEDGRPQQPEPRGQADVAVDDRGDRMCQAAQIRPETNATPVNGNTLARSGTRNPRQPTSSPVCRTNSMFGNRRNRRSRCRAMPPGSRRSG
jgi:hypothetical protein